MAEFPALPLWTDRYLSDTRHLTAETHGAYLLLLMEAWRRPRCTLPDDDDMLAKLASVPPQRWAEIKPVVMGFWTLDSRSGEWRQKTLTKERKFVEKKRVDNREKALKRWNKTKKHDATAMPRQCDPTPTEEVISSLRSDIAKHPKSTPRQELEFVLDPEHAEAVLDHRKRLRKPLSVRAAKLLAGKFARTADPNGAADVMIERGWQGFDPDWLKGANGHDKTKRSTADLAREFADWSEPRDDPGARLLVLPRGRRD